MNPGDRVEMTEAALQKGLDGPSHRRTGVIKAVNHEGDYLRVQRDGAKDDKTELYAVAFWRKVK